MSITQFLRAVGGDGPQKPEVQSQWRVLHGDALTVLHTLPDRHAQMCLTSPPYFGLRDYGHTQQLGLEPSPEGYVHALLPVFAEVWRVLKNDGTLWLNLGDSYFGDSPARKTSAEGFSTTWNPADSRGRGGQRRSAARVGSLKPKDLIGIPWRVAFALQDAGWYLRSDIIWSKPNPMPESVTDRPTKAHEYLFLLTKQEQYYYDAEAIKEPVSNHPVTMARNTRADKGVVGPKDLHGSSWGQSGQGGFDRRDLNGRNKRDVWTIPVQPCADAHFATFPDALVLPCVLAGSREGEVVLDPFAGSGTAGVVALGHRRSFVGIELNPKYVDIARRRLGEAAPLFAVEDPTGTPSVSGPA